jgi:hypothetical protein
LLDDSPKRDRRFRSESGAHVGKVDAVGTDDLELLAPAPPILLLRPGESECLTVLGPRVWALSDAVVS